jgi:hypothetical protein
MTSWASSQKLPLAEELTANETFQETTVALLCSWIDVSHTNGDHGKRERARQGCRVGLSTARNSRRRSDETSYQLAADSLSLCSAAKIDNGGFRYLFESDFPFHPPYSLFSDAYRKIGAFDAADRLDRAVRLFPFPSPETQQEARNAFMNSLHESAELFSLGDEVCGDDRVWQLMEQYVKTNASVFAPKP